MADSDHVVMYYRDCVSRSAKVPHGSLFRAQNWLQYPYQTSRENRRSEHLPVEAYLLVTLQVFRSSSQLSNY